MTKPWIDRIVVGLLLAIGGTPGLSARLLVPPEAKTIERAFELRPRELDGLHFDVYSPGQVTATATWDGPPGVLAMTIIGPGPSRPSRTATGGSPLVVRLELGENDLVSGMTCRVRIGGDVKGPVHGKLQVRYPGGLPPRGLLSLQSGSVAFNEKCNKVFLQEDHWGTSARQAFVKLERLPTNAEREELGKSGVHLGDFLGDKTFRATVNDRRPAEAAIQGDLVDAIAPVDPNHKVETRIALRQFSRFLAGTGKKGAKKNYVLNPNGSVNLTVHFLPSTNDAKIREILGGVAIAARPLAEKSWVVTVLPGEIDKLAHLDDVTWIGPAPAPAAAENDHTRRALNVDPLHNIRTAHRPATYDLAGAGDPDLLFGDAQGRVWVSWNSGTLGNPCFRAPTPVLAGGLEIRVAGRAVPTLGDADGDGDLDLFVGDATGQVSYFRNDGTDASPSYAAGIPLLAGGKPLMTALNASPVAWDFNLNGLVDLVVGDAAGHVWLFINTGNAPDDPSYAPPMKLSAGGVDLGVGHDAHPTFEDFDGDGRQDLLVGDAEGHVLVCLNVGDDNAPKYSTPTPVNSGDKPIDVGSGAAPVFADLDGDRLDDLVVGNEAGEFLFFKNVSKGSSPLFGSGVVLPLPPTPTPQGFAAPMIRDLDLDGFRVANAEPGQAESGHRDFSGRIVFRPPSDAGGTDGHATHVTGIMAGAGLSSELRDAFGIPNGGKPYQWRGMAPGAGILFLADISDMSRHYQAIVGLKADVINGSITVSWDGNYDELNRIRDQVIRGDGASAGASITPTPMAFSAGNDGQEPSNSGSQRGYFSLTKQFKNVIVVGNWDASAPTPGLAPDSSLGPTSDGRIKPDLVAPGSQVVSCYNADKLNGYYADSGTSMASPAVAGIIILVQECWERTYGVPHGRARPLPSTHRALLIQTARDIDWVNNPPPGKSNPAFTNVDGPVSFFPGPDFATGWGLVDACNAAAVVKAKSIIESHVATKGVKEFPFRVSQAEMPVKVTLAWDDPASDVATPISATHLVNDLDLELQSPDGTIHYPFALDQEIVSAEDETRVLAPQDQTPGTNIKVIHKIQPRLDPAFDGVDYPNKDIPVRAANRGRDHVNNVEQVLTSGPDGIWVARVRGFAVAQGPQRFSLVGPWGDDTGKPELTGPAVFEVVATTPAGYPSANLTVQSMGVAVHDDRDPIPTVTLSAPPVLPVGDTTVTYTARDASGNTVDLKTLIRVKQGSR